MEEKKKHYLVYKITNLVNGKIYIGQHETYDPNDNYMGSGNLIRRAIKKYGVENFKKEILFDFETREEMNQKEAELVNESFVQRKDTYNITTGGVGGFNHVNSIRRNWSKEQWKEFGKKISDKVTPINRSQEKRAISSHFWKEYNLAHRHNNPMKGKHHTQETKQKISNKINGKNNGMFGKHWLFDSDGKRICLWDGKTPKPENLFLKEELYQFRLLLLPKRYQIRALETHNSRWINNGKIEKYVIVTELNDYLEQGWIKGRLPRNILRKLH